jgi:hypothetical protein
MGSRCRGSPVYVTVVLQSYSNLWEYVGDSRHGKIQTPKESTEIHDFVTCDCEERENGTLPHYGM